MILKILSNNLLWEASPTLCEGNMTLPSSNEMSHILFINVVEIRTNLGKVISIRFCYLVRKWSNHQPGRWFSIVPRDLNISGWNEARRRRCFVSEGSIFVSQGLSVHSAPHYKGLCGTEGPENPWLAKCIGGCPYLF